jgi:pilus assembly protein CpaE
LTAINLAAGLAKEGYQTCLVDLDLQFGDVMGYLDMVSDVTLSDAQAALERDAASFWVEDYLTEYNCGGVSFSILPPPKEINDAYLVNVDTVAEIIQRMDSFNFIVLDLTSVFSTLNLVMLDMSTIINFVGVADFLPSIKNFKVGYDTLLRFEYEERKICLVENRADDDRYISYRDVEKLLGAQFFHRLPVDSQAITQSIRMGRPLMFSAPLSPLTQSYWQLVGCYTNRNATTAQLQEMGVEPAPKKESHFFSWFRGRNEREADGSK